MIRSDYLGALRTIGAVCCPKSMSLCSPVVHGLCFSTYAIVLAELIWTINLYRSHRDYHHAAYIGIAAVFLVIVSSATAGCLMDSSVVFYSLHFLYYVITACYESLLIRRFTTFRHILDIRDSYMNAFIVVYWISATGMIVGSLTYDNTVYIASGSVLGTMTIFIEGVTGFATLKVVMGVKQHKKNAQWSQQQIATITKHARIAFVSLLVACIGVTVGTVIIIVLSLSDTISIYSFFYFLTSVIAGTSVLAQEHTREILRCKSVVNSVAQQSTNHIAWKSEGSVDNTSS